MPGGIFPSLPSGMDAVLKKHFDSFRERGALPPELKSTGAHLFKDMNQLREWRNNFRGIRWQDSKGNVLHGAVDDILVKGGKLIVLDYKTRGFPCKDDTHEHYQKQLDIYNFLLRKNGRETEDYAYLLFFHPTNVNSNGDIVFERTLKKVETNTESAGKLFSQAVKCLEGPEPKSGKECGVCGYLRERK